MMTGNNERKCVTDESNVLNISLQRELDEIVTLKSGLA